MTAVYGLNKGFRRVTEIYVKTEHVLKRKYKLLNVSQPSP